MKKKLIAVLLCALLVVSAVLVLAACNNTPVIIFRSNDGRKYFELEAKGGKLTKEQVDKAYKDNNIKNGDKIFMGWYQTVGQVDGIYTYDDPIDYDKTYEDGTEFYAYWHVGAGLPQGYTLIGVIGGVKNWTPGTESENWMLEQDPDQPWLYRKTIDVQKGDEIKVKEKSDKWNDDICNLGYDGCAEVILSDAVKADLTSKGIDAKYMSKNAGGNFGIGTIVTEANITVEYDFSILKYRVTYNTATVALPETVDTWILVGTLVEGSWTADNSNPKVLFTAKEGEKYVLTLTYNLRANDEFKFKIKNPEWVGDIGFGGFSYSAADGVKLPKDLFVEGIGDDGKGNGNIVCSTACTVVFTLDVLLNSVSAVVTSVGAAA